MPNSNRPATGAMIMIVRGRMPNQARLDTPMNESEAWTLLRDSHSLDYRRLAAHCLIDLTVAAKDSPALDLVIMYLEYSDVLCAGLLRRIENQRVCRGWQKWAKRQRQLAFVPAMAA